MLRFGHVLLLLGCCFLLVSCGVKTKAPTVSDRATAIEEEMQRQAVAEKEEEHRQRLYRVGNLVRTANVDLCGEKVANYDGFYAATLLVYPKEWRSAQAAVRGLDDRLRVTYVFADSPSERAGLTVGDVIKSIGGTDIPEGKEAMKVYVDKTGMLDYSEPFEMVVEHNGVDHTVRIEPEKICGARLRVGPETFVNAFASKDTVTVTKGMLEFLESDDELALIIGHEFGHYAMQHIEDATKRASVGMVADVLLAVFTGVSTNAFASMGAGMYSLEQEYEADYVGAYMSCRGGFDPSVGPQLWRRMSAHAAVYTDKDGSTHPSNAARGARLKEIMAEIDGKQKRGEDLLPNFTE